jgi:hypothetical protein
MAMHRDEELFRQAEHFQAIQKLLREHFTVTMTLSREFTADHHVVHVCPHCLGSGRVADEPEPEEPPASANTDQA